MDVVVFDAGNEYRILVPLGPIQNLTTVAGE
jgi:hypothetical protein